MFVVRRKFAVECVFTFTLLSITSRTLFLSRLSGTAAARYNRCWPLLIKTWFSNAALISRQMRSFVVIRVLATINNTLYETSLQLCLCTHSLRDRHHGLFVSNGANAWQNSSSRSKHSSYRCSHAKYSTRIVIWPHCSSSSRSTRLWFSMFFFSQSLDRTLPCTWLVYICCSIALHLECHNVVTRHCVFRQRFFIFKTLIITLLQNKLFREALHSKNSRT